MILRRSGKPRLRALLRQRRGGTRLRRIEQISQLLSIGLPQLAGGGAEKVTLKLASHFYGDRRLSRLYTGSIAGADRVGPLPLVDLGASRAAVSALPFARALRDDPADTFLLTLGYIGLAPLIRMRRRYGRIVLRIGNTPTPELALLGRVARLRYLSVLWLSFRAADAIIAQSAYMANDLAGLVPHARRKLVTIYNPVEAGLWSWQAPRDRLLAEPYLFCAATMKPQKALDVLLEAFARSAARQSRRLVVAGVAPDDARFAALMAAAGLDEAEVVRPGFVANPYDWMAHCDACVLTSRFEGFSNFLLEAAALGKRIVATDSPGGNAELFALYPNVEAVPVGDLDAIARAMDTPRRDLDRGQARNYLEPFEQDHILRQYEDVIFGSSPPPTPRS